MRANRWQNLTLAERFAMKVEQSAFSDCVIWLGAQDGHGYGQINVNGMPIKAHRIAWQLQRGEIPADLTIDHLCTNRLCQNVEHLELVTRAENGRRGSATKGRKLACVNGHPFNRDTDKWKPCRICRREANRRYRLRLKERSL